jgi:serine/threonine protein kinase
MATETDQFRELLDRWEELRESVQDPDVGELCRDCPQLADRLRDWVRVLKLSEWLSRPADEVASETLAGADMLVASDREQLKTIGEYTLLEELGGGGMGRVFRAVHRKLHREVAVKVLPQTALQSRESVERFQRETHALAKLSHVNIVAVHDAGIVEGTHYFVMDLVDGKDLSRLVHDDGPLSPERAVDCVLQVARGLEYAHASGVIHRDIKPSNLMLDARGKVQILDLGIARVEATDDAPTDLTRTGSILGTVDYMAPEQALSTRAADQRADVYSLGCTLYFLLTAQTVYGGDTVMQRLVAHREHPVPSLSKACSSAPAWLDQVFQRMIAKRPQDRMQSMTEVISALEQKARPQLRQRWRIPLIFGFLILLGLAAGGLLVKSAWHTSPVSRTWRMIEDKPLIAGVWKEWDGIVLNITQNGEHISADCTYGQPDVTVHWRADGTISPDGKITAQLVHTDPPRTAPAKPQFCTAQLQPDGQTIRGHAAWTNGGDDFTWRLQEPTAADETAVHH